MRVLHLFSGTDRGGAKTHVVTLLKELNSEIEVALGCLSRGPIVDECRDAGVEVHLLDQVTRYDLRVLGRLCGLVRRRGFDIIHAHGPRANLMVALSRGSFRRPAATTVHSDWRSDFADSPLRNLIFGRLNAWALRRFDAYLVGVGAEESLRALGVPPEAMHPVRNGLDFSARPPVPPRQEVLRRLGLDPREEGPLVGIMARLHPVKSHEVFLEGAARVARRHPGALFLVAGEGSSRAALEAMAERLGLGRRVRFLGHVADPDEVYSVLDVNCLTSFSETLPYALLEGARWKVATISSRVGGIPELIRDGVTGRLFEPGDVDGFTRCLEELLSSPSRRRELGENLYTHASRRFSSRAMAEVYLDVYRELVERSKAR
ncbi:MAG: glycosyltransferase [Firmicutes bacterium]|nr:glycosyltransferase [Bacillota bacterium]